MTKLRRSKKPASKSRLVWAVSVFAVASWGIEDQAWGRDVLLTSQNTRVLIESTQNRLGLVLGRGQPSVILDAIDQVPQRSSKAIWKHMGATVLILAHVDLTQATAAGPQVSALDYDGWVFFQSHYNNLVPVTVIGGLSNTHNKALPFAMALKSAKYDFAVRRYNFVDRGGNGPPVPEPGSLSLGAVAVLSAVCLRRRRAAL